jgi:hypothetical protein
MWAIGVAPCIVRPLDPMHLAHILHIEQSEEQSLSVENFVSFLRGHALSSDQQASQILGRILGAVISQG